MDSSHQIEPPNTRLTKILRGLWECTDEREPWPDWYARQCRGDSSTNGRAIAAVLSDHVHSHGYWPQMYKPADIPAIVVWGDLFDRSLPTATPEIICRAADVVHLAGIKHPVPYEIIQAALMVMRGLAQIDEFEDE
ncbi:hypothetical protein [Mycolicibacterium phocaicum]|uniref:hypothetical protein n=1 Tax=Mycolicibacterium phocaicum TaxID=319706 RepID=UPI001CF96D3A|nr:hypothetical protein [Mycolicibacterium phocaicum]UCZ58675.1 hypothetical protein LHJ73_18030 [Mycolicibacterium phocaicum]